MECRTITIEEKEYPKRLKNIKYPPKTLYVAGKLPRQERLSVAIVGARQCSVYGRNMAREMGEALAKEGVQIISGMALGIDGEAQKGALDVGGETYAVLGSGVDICYPREHFGLYEKLQEQGGILSEQPLGTKPLPQYFPARNRIISGLADVILVIEAKEKSGSLITADMALEQGKDVYALPGPVNSNLSRGCNKLIKQGAGIVISVEDFMEELQISHWEKLENEKQNKILLEREEILVYTCLDLYPKSLETLARETALSISELMHIIFCLELKGYVQEISKNYYVKIK